MFRREHGACAKSALGLQEGQTRSDEPADAFVFVVDDNYGGRPAHAQRLPQQSAAAAMRRDDVGGVVDEIQRFVQHRHRG